MQIKEINISKLKPYPNNSRVHDEQQIQQIILSIKEFGFTNPILIDEDSLVIAGHGRLSAAKQMGLKNVPTITLTGLTDNQKKAYIIADNKLALNAEWNDELLQKEIEALAELEFDLSLLGWSENEINSFVGDPLSDIFSEKEYTGAKEISLEDIDNFEHQCPRCGFNYNLE